jgi:hypothetical protein
VSIVAEKFDNAKDACDVSPAMHWRLGTYQFETIGTRHRLIVNQPMGI